ncbi:MAG TPA: ABC transporter permease [Puia sp.]|nr:ABC transporter permease [Puia sp.]
MFRIHLRTALRHFTRNRLYSFLNVLGLATGLAACIVILLFVFYEKSFDAMHPANIYRLNERQTFTGTGIVQNEAATMFPMGPTLKAEFPAILNFSRVAVNDQYEITYGDRRLFLPSTYFVDTAFLHMFNFPLRKGDRHTVLQKPNSIVLTESAARELFGNADPVGKTISHFGDDTLLFTVTGILKDVPPNTQFQFDALQSFNTIYKPDWINRWGTSWVFTYLELAPNADRATLEKQFPAYGQAHHLSGPEIHNDLFLLPLKDIHAGAADFKDDDINFRKFDDRYTNIFMGIGLLVLLIACINFMNLATAQSAERGKEVGIRKTIGALRSQLGFQFLVESTLLAVIALVVAFGLVRLILPAMDQLTGRKLSPLLSVHPGLLAVLFAGTILIGIFSGLYPAFYLSSFRPVTVLKGGGGTGKEKGGFRSILVVAQFTSAVFLVIATILMFRQLHYMEQQDPGFDRDQMVTIDLHGITSRKYHLLKQELAASPLVSGVTGAGYQLGGEMSPLGIGFWPGNRPMQVLVTGGIFVDPDYLTLYKIPLLAGRNFSRDKSAGGKESIINESLARQLLKDQPGGTPLSWLIGKYFGGDTLGSIVGVCKDFNFNSLHYKIEPIFLMNEPQWSFNRMSVKIDGRQAGPAIGLIQSTWKHVLPEYPFAYQFLDDHFKELYRTDTQVSRMVAIMAGLAILISCLGLFGLASFSAEKRTKEIGIRKVLGASVKDIVILLSRHFFGLVVIANLIAWPLAWIALHRWIRGYAYSVSISWWIFVLAGITALLIALATVSFRAIKAALSNPVNALRSE